MNMRTNYSTWSVYPFVFLLFSSSLCAILSLYLSAYELFTVSAVLFVSYDRHLCDVPVIVLHMRIQLFKLQTHIWPLIWHFWSSTVVMTHFCFHKLQWHIILIVNTIGNCNPQTRKTDISQRLIDMTYSSHLSGEVLLAG